MKQHSLFFRLLLVLLIFSLTLSLPACTGGENEIPEATVGEEHTTDSLASSEEGTAELPLPSDLQLVLDGATTYQIVRSDNASSAVSEAAIRLRDAMKKATGVTIPIVTDWENDKVASAAKAQDREIVIGKTSRDPKYYTFDISSYGSFDFAVAVSGERLLLTGGSDAAAISAVDYFIANLLTGASEGSFSLSKEVFYKQEASNDGYVILSQNLLATDTEYASFDNAADHTVAKRQERIRKLFMTHQPLSIGLQECSKVWRTYFDKMASSWAYKRTGASKNEKISILYNAELLRLVDSGSIYLTEDPENLKISVEWKGSTERLAHYAVFQIRETKECYIHVNTHIGFDNATVALNQARVVREYCEKLQQEKGYPVVCTGDFNFDLNSEPYKEFIKGGMEDTKLTAVESSTGTGSFNKMGTEGYPKAYPIDQVMVSKGDWNVHTYMVDYTTFDGFYASDHYAVLAKLSFKKK